MNTEVRNSDTRTTIDTLAEKLHNASVIKTSHIVKALEQQACTDAFKLRTIREEQDKLRRQWMEFRDLEEQAKRREERLQRTLGLIGNHKSDGLKTVLDDERLDGFITPLPNDLALWEAIVTVLEQVEEIQLYELQEVLVELGKKVSRQAMESAINTHRESFETKTRGRERFVSLKRSKKGA